MTARIAAILIVVSALIGGGLLYYQQVYAYYEEVGIEQTGPVEILGANGAVMPVEFDDFQAIDGSSSPIRFRACFTLPEPQSFAASAQPYAAAEPLVAPRWFDCFDADEIGAALENGTARAYLWRENQPYGIDRVVAVMPDGRAFAWQQINACGAVVFDGSPAPDFCPPPPESQS